MTIDVLISNDRKQCAEQSMFSALFLSRAIYYSIHNKSKKSNINIKVV